MPFDILVNNAGVDRPGSILKADAEGIDLLVDVNLRAVLHLCRLVVPGMVVYVLTRIRNHGRIFNAFEWVVVAVVLVAAIAAVVGIAQGTVTLD